MEIKREKAAYGDINGERVYFDVLGKELKVGDKAPDFALFDRYGRIARITDFSAKRKLFNVVNSIDTIVCKDSIFKLDDLHREGKAAEYNFYTVSVDLPFAFQRFYIDELINPNHIFLSDYRDRKFGVDYGVLMLTDRREDILDKLLQRAVFIIEPNDTISYVKYFENQSIMPDYTEALEVLTM